MDRLSSYRSFYSQLITSNAGVRTTSPSLVEAFAATPREKFLGPGPWKVFTPQGYLETPSDDPALLYQDITIALKEETRINNGQPSLHAMCLGALQIEPGEVVAHVGVGTGYYSAVIANLVGISGRVCGFEIDDDLADRAERNLADYDGVSVYKRSGATADIPASDVIYVNAGATEPLDIWLDALCPEGRLLFPLTGTGGAGAMLLVTKRSNDTYAARFIVPAIFTPCIGARDDETADRITKAYRRGDSRQVCSLRRNTTPDSSCWLSGDNWWLSTTAE